MRKNHFISTLAVACLVAFASNASSLAQSLNPLPAAVAADSVEVSDFEWNDGTRNRAVPARLYWPAKASTDADGKVPLVVFSHGMGGSRMGYSYLGRYWADQGYAVLHLQHAGSDRAVWTSGFFSMVSNLQNAASDTNAIARAQDVSFGISTLLADARYAPRIDATRIAVAGHSYGANTAMLVAGATVERGGKVLSFRDERVMAAIILSAPPFYGDGDMQRILKPLTIPTLHITGTEDTIRIPGYYSDTRDRIAVYDAVPGANKVLAVFNGASHSVFTDRMAGSPEVSRSVKTGTRELSANFLNTVMRNAAPQGLRDWLANNKALLARAESGF